MGHWTNSRERDWFAYHPRVTGPIDPTLRRLVREQKIRWNRDAKRGFRVISPTKKVNDTWKLFIRKFASLGNSEQRVQSEPVLLLGVNEWKPVTAKVILGTKSAWRKRITKIEE